MESWKGEGGSEALRLLCVDQINVAHCIVGAVLSLAAKLSNCLDNNGQLLPLIKLNKS